MYSYFTKNKMSMFSKVKFGLIFVQFKPALPSFCLWFVFAMRLLFQIYYQFYKTSIL